MTDCKLIALPGGKDSPLDDRADDALMLLASAGRTDAFAVLVARYAKRLSNLCAKLVCARGPSELFRALFSHPFGRQALAAYLWQATASTPPPIGIAQEDIA